MVRMQADARLPIAEQLGYKHVGDALARIVKEEGLLTYWRGATPTGARVRFRNSQYLTHQYFFSSQRFPHLTG